MIKNRYGGQISKDNQLIINLHPANYTLRLELSLEIKRIAKNKRNIKILEIGSGEGDLTKYILEQNGSLKIDILDISPEMIKVSKKGLARFSNRINFICQDAAAYLKNNDLQYDIICSAWTIHNFKQSDKQTTFKSIYQVLKPGGHLLLMDKVYPDNKKEQNKLLQIQLNRYKKYLPKKLCNTIIKHEKQDLLASYIMVENKTIKTLKRIGFKNIDIADRIEREVLFLARK